MEAPTKILTIDDDRGIRSSIRAFLEDLDYQVLEAVDGQLGLALFEQEHPDLVLVDLRMPESDGFDVLGKIRVVSPDTPVVVISGTGVIGDVVRALRLGAWNYLLKPIQDLTVLRHAVEQALERARLIDERRRYQQQLQEEVTQRTEELRHHQAHLTELVAERTRDLQREIVERKAAEASLKRSEQRFRDIAESASDWVWELDSDLRFSYVSERALVIFGCQRDDLIGRRRIELASAVDLERDPRKWRHHTEQLERHQPFRGFEYELEVVKGKKLTIQLSGNPVFSEAGGFVGYRGTGTDVTALRAAQGKLLQSEKMAALGGLVAGVAHEINTPVGIGVTASSHLRDMVVRFDQRYRLDQAGREDLEEFLEDAGQAVDIISSNLQRAVDLIRSFKQVAVDQSTQERRRFNLGEYLDEVLLSLRPQLKRRQHQVTVDCPANIELNSYPGALSQIVTNLVMNSLVHGFEGKERGTIAIRAGRLEQGILLVYRDDGEGMDPVKADRIFEPFYTTKRGSGGSGLGLSIVFNLVTEKLGGSIECVTSPGQGVEYRILLPA